jgi:pyruvate formate-lyase activating enzyme-like uncharacterized protein
MTRSVKLSRGGSPYVGSLPKGCRACIKGSKLVLFITGYCTKGCYYCPISEERFGEDVTYANEVLVEKAEDALEEARMIDAEGMGITGGEPLLELERTCQYIRLFKRKFGSNFHIHLYTALEPLPNNIVEQLLDAGLDELRLHRYTSGEDLDTLREITSRRAQLGVEVPAIPGQLNQMKQLLRNLDAASIDFVNINEMEFAPLNANELLKRGFSLDPNSIAGVKGSEDMAISLLDWAAENTSLNIHFCPIALKDGTQLRNRFRRRAKHVVKPFERINRDGLLVKGVITPPSGMTLSEAYTILCKDFQVSSEQVWINEKQSRLETSAVWVRRIARRLKRLGFSVGIAEEYPIKTRFQVSYTPV